MCLWYKYPLNPKTTQETPKEWTRTQPTHHKQNHIPQNKPKITHQSNEKHHRRPNTQPHTKNAPERTQTHQKSTKRKRASNEHHHKPIFYLLVIFYYVKIFFLRLSALITLSAIKKNVIKHSFYAFFAPSRTSLPFLR